MHITRLATSVLLGALAIACASAPTASTSPEASCRSYALPNNPDVTPPRLIHGDQPALAGDSTSGFVCVRATITPSGSVIDPVVVQTDNKAFASAFVSALSDWRYEPATRGSAKVSYHTALFARIPGGGHSG